MTPVAVAAQVGAAPALAVAARLRAPAPAWTLETDVLVIGSGVAGLTLVHGLRDSGLRVHLITKGTLDEGSTRWAQGGIARATTDLDDVALHERDTLVAGAGLCDPAAVRTLVTEGRAAVDWLAAAGARFDAGDDGQPAQTREGGHSRARIVHAGGDSTGREVQRALLEALRSAPVGRTVGEHTMLLDLLRADDGGVVGALVAECTPTGALRSVGRVLARATVLASGGLGQAFASTTNPPVVTGDGIAAALRAGADVADLEFVQFHPTVLFLPGMHQQGGTAGRAGRRLLISEAVRGEGAIIVDRHGAPVMAGHHPLADLAPRDVVSATMQAHMLATGEDHLYLDARGLGEATLLARFPTIVAGCREQGIDPVTEPIPVHPGAHYTCGGVRADLDGVTSLPGLYALGEVSATGVHGANRLASNSLLEGLVAGRRLAARLADRLPAARAALPVRPEDGPLVRAGLREELALGMDRAAGVLRDPESLARFAVRLHDAGGADAARTDGHERATWEATNLHTLMSALVAAAHRRRESRGCHRRTDVTQPRPEWLTHVHPGLTEPGLDGRSLIDVEVRP